MNSQPFSQTGQMIELCYEYLSARCIWLYVIITSRTSFRANLHSIVCLNVKELLARKKRHIWSLSHCNGLSQMHCTDKYSQENSIIWPAWLNGWVFIYELSGFWFESRCCHLKFRYDTCFEQEVPWHSGKL